MVFKDRQQAGERLCDRLADLENQSDAIVVGLPRGGVIVAKEVAEGLGLPLDVIVAKKIGAPGNPELAIGAIAGGVRVLDEKIIKEYRIQEDYVRTAIAMQEEEIRRRLGLYRHGRPPLDLGGKTVVIVDDGIATGATMLAAIRYAKTMAAREIVAAVPVASEEALEKISKDEAVDRVVCLERAGPYFFAVGEYYEHFSQVSDEEVVQALQSIRSKA